MASRSAATIRNIAFGGHSAAGKTTLVEHLLHSGGAISRPGSVDDGNAVCDFDELEKESKHSIDLACAHVDHAGVRLNFIDTPGYRDFFAQFICATAAVDCVVVVVSAEDGVLPNTRKVWATAEQMGLPRLVVVNRLDREHADWDRTLEQIREQLGAQCVPLTVPDGSGSSFTKVEKLIGASGREEANQLLESIIETDEALMEKYLEGEEPSPEVVASTLASAIRSSSVFPVLATSATKGIGVPELLDVLATFTPAADTNPAGRKLFAMGKDGALGDEVELSFDASAPFCARVFKVVSDPYVGKLSLIRVFSGSLAAGQSFVNPHTGKSEKVGKIVELQGKEQKPVETAQAGDIVAFVKIESLKAFDVIHAQEIYGMERPPVPTPMSSYAVQPKTKADEKKFAESFQKVIDEDVSLRAERDRRTHELVVSGMSQLHLQVTWERLKRRFGVEVETKEPKVPYLETISAKGDDMYRHKKQSGGAGEFGEVWLRVEPNERGAGIEFVNEVFGGAISASYVQSAEKGIRSVMEHGLISGSPMVDIKVTIYDGKEHPVDSKDIAFQKAGREAFKKAFQKAKPILLEPIVLLEVTFPPEAMGDVQGDLTRRRGRVQGVDSIGGLQVLKALVPLAEIADYASTLNSMTGGQGSYVIEPSHYEQVPPNIQQQVVAAHEKEGLQEAS